VTLQRGYGDYGAEGILCAAFCDAWISCFCSAGLPATITEWSPHLPTALGVGISSSRQRVAFVKGKRQGVHVSEENVEGVRKTIGLHFRSLSQHAPHSHSWHLQFTTRIAHRFLRTVNKRLSHSFHSFFWHAGGLHVSLY
jgi:hypothetical protein